MIEVPLYGPIMALPDGTFELWVRGGQHVIRVTYRQLIRQSELRRACMNQATWFPPERDWFHWRWTVMHLLSMAREDWREHYGY